jgi:tetratricopeptide (TPR) repeat protein
MIVLSEPRLEVGREPRVDRSLAQEVLKHFRKGNDLFDAKDFHGAVREYEAALSLLPNDETILNNRGATLGALGRYDEALISYDRALRIRPDDAVTLFNRGIALAQLGRREEAVAAYDRALALMPNDPATWANRGLALMQLKRHSEGLTSIDKAIELSPADPGLITCRQQILRDLLRRITDQGVVSWSGGRPMGSRPPVAVTPGPPVSDYVSNDRR